MASTAQYAAPQPYLTKFSVAKIPDQNFAARRVLPWCPVPDEDFRYTVFDGNDFVPGSAEAGEKFGARNMHGDYVPVDAGFSNAAGTCTEFGFESKIDKREYARGMSAGVDVRKMKSLTVRSFVMSAREQRAAALLFNSTTFSGYTAALSGTNRWDDASSDPLDQAVAAKQSTIKAASAMFAGARWCCIVGQEVMDKLRTNGAIIDRVQYTSGVKRGAVDDAQIANYLGVDELIVGAAIKNGIKDTGTGALTSPAFIWGKGALFFWKAPTPAPMIPSLGYTFGVEDFMVEEYVDNARRSDVLRGRELCVEKVCNAAAGYYYSTVIT